MSYLIHRVAGEPFPGGRIDPEVFTAAETAKIASFRRESGAVRPECTAKLLYDARGIYGLFEVKGEKIRAAAEKFNDPVCLDSCVEFFVTPNSKFGYCNFEFSANGTFLAMHIRDPRRGEHGFADFRKLEASEGAQVQVFPERTGRIDDAEPSDWRLGFFLPFTLLLSIFRTAHPDTGTEWRGNLYKCGDRTDNPHWAALFPVTELNFHLPQCFGTLLFG